VTRFQKLVAATLAMTLALVIVGVVVRATGSGLGCPDWPFCYGQVVPPLEFRAWAEWIHRLIAAVIGVMIVGVAVLAVVDHRERRSLVAASLGAVALVVFQAWLGRETVRLGNSGPSVTAHLAAAMAVAGLLTFLLVRAGYPARLPRSGGSQGFTLLAAFTAASTFVLLIFGANVTAADAALIFPDWPLMGGAIVPPFGDMPLGTATLAFTQAIHRYVGVVVGIVLAGTWIAAWRGRRAGRVNRGLFALVTIAAVLYPMQALVGALQVWTQLAPWTQTLHVALAAFVWVAAIGAAFVSYYGARAAALDGGAPARPTGAVSTGGAASQALAGAEVQGSTGGEDPAAAPGPDPAPSAGPDPQAAPDPPAAPVPGAASGRALSGTIRAYVALTKPRIIELLLITTIPAMVLATRDLPGVNWIDWGWLVVWTLVGGTLAAGSANAINQYLDRDIDVLMVRTRRRPLPAHSVEPEQALVFGIVLGVISIGLLAYFVNLVAAFLTLLAIAFYVFVYTMLLKRTTTQNIVIGGAAGALPPVIGWAAVTGRVEIPALFLFALVFYWTPPHFWALSLRIAKDYAAAGLPMLPVVRGAAETTRQILLYTILLVVISLVFFIVAKMGLIYLVAAVVMGALFLWRAAKLSRTVTVEGTTAGAIGLYKFSISYLTVLFAAVAVDALVMIRIA
jgi:protoheme IX farnesyltransferase